jgi:hypothetical protein
MNDVMLYARLKQLGMPDAKAWDLTAKIRDTLHPIAAVAANKIYTAAKQQNQLGAPGAAAALQDASIGAKAATVGVAIASGVSLAATGAALGSVVPVVGTAIGAVVGLLVGALFGPAKEGQAAETWDDMVKNAYLFKTLGRAFDERYFAEALKGMMDKGNNAWPGCGKDGYKNPDCFAGPLAQTIVKGYLAKTVPLSATTAQVYNSIVVPWLKSGAGGIFTWAPYAAENAANGNIQGLMVTALVDRYLAGLPVTRADMPEYAGQGYTDHEPTLNVALASLLQTTAAPSPSPSVALAQAPTATVTPAVAKAATTIAAPVIAAQAIPVQAVTTANISSVATPAGVTPATVAPLTPVQDSTAAILTPMIANEGANMVTPAAQQLVADVAANGVQQTPYGPPTAFDLSSIPWWGWALGAGAAVWFATKK